MKTSFKQQLNELVTRIDFPMIIYLYETGHIIALNTKAKYLVGQNLNNMNKIWEENSKLKVSQDMLNNKSFIMHQRYISNKTDRIAVDIEISSINLGQEHLMIVLFEQSYKRVFRKRHRKQLLRILWRDKKGMLIGCNTFLEKDKERDVIEKCMKEDSEANFDQKRIFNQYKQLLMTQESQFDIIQEVELEDGNKSFARLNRIALFNKNGTMIGSLTIYALMLENDPMQLFQDDILRENNILKEAISRSNLIAVSWEKGAKGVVDFISPNIIRWGYSCKDFYEEGLNFQDIIVKEDYPLFQYKNMGLESTGKSELTVIYRIRKKNGEVIWVKDETTESTIKDGINFKQGILMETESLFLNNKERAICDLRQRELKNKKIDSKLSLNYQPIISSDGKKCIGAEAFLRWKNGKDEEISPLDILSLSEYMGVINEVSDFVFQEAFLMCREQNDRLKETFFVHINLSIIELANPEIVDRICKLAEKTKVNPACVVFEIKESVVFEEFEIMKAVLLQLKEVGFFVLLDNFGTGISSFHTVMELPLDYIKMNESFIQNYGTDKFKPSLLVAIIELAHRLNIKVIVSGIETKNQMEFLFLSDIDAYQGYYFGYPVPKNKFS
ncbi:MAG: EAL domain-containing protein [Velocimicrobium sp.]